jgi:guanine nucleotide-binding protein alpha-1 subunit
LAFTPNQFQKERSVWKTIIQLNLISSVKTIFQVLSETDEIDSERPFTPPPTSGGPLDNSKFRKIHLSLSPLLSIETDLNKILFSTASSREICVPAGSKWKFKLGFRDSTSTRESFDAESDMYRLTNAQNAARNSFISLLEASKEDIIALWQDNDIQRALEEKEVSLRDTPGFFLDDVGRIASSTYEPTDSDIVRARLKTVGVEEHHLVAESPALKKSDFYITDVSGMRSSRGSWVPFFDDTHAILFLVPLAFNQMLEEDPHVNRLEDSLSLWKDICKNILLANCNIIIFFNKMDILRRTLESGVEVRKYVPSYGDAPNDVVSVTKYFKDRFKTYHKKLSPKPRAFISHETSAIDVRSTTALVVTVHDGIIRDNLEKSDMI